MKTILTNVLKGFGLVPAGQLRQSVDDSRQTSGKVKSLEDRIGKMRADTETWKARHDDLAAKLREWKDAATKAGAEAERLRAGAEHAKARAAEWKARAEAATEEKLSLRARLEEAQRAAIIAREHVMATETKLDVIEAAIQVLDRRTREEALNRS
jgi:chromosome segregation ATPase